MKIGTAFGLFQGDSDGVSVGRSRLRLAISSRVGETQSREAASNWTNMVAIWGRLRGSASQHCSISTHTSSDSPRMSRFIGRGGRFPSRTNPGTTSSASRENGRWWARIFESRLSGVSYWERKAANLIGYHPQSINVRLFRWMRVLDE